MDCRFYFFEFFITVDIDIAVYFVQLNSLILKFVFVTWRVQESTNQLTFKLKVILQTCSRSRIQMDHRLYLFITVDIDIAVYLVQLNKLTLTLVFVTW